MEETEERGFSPTDATFKIDRHKETLPPFGRRDTAGEKLLLMLIDATAPHASRVASIRINNTSKNRNKNHPNIPVKPS